MITLHEAILRIALAFVGSMLFGLERQFKKKPVGFGAFTFVTVGSTMLTVLAERVGSNLPIHGAIITGIGFLGAGAILKSGEKKVTGITTAASIWAFAALGITLGVGQYLLALLFYILIASIIIMDHYFEKHGFGAYSKTATITLSDATKIKEVERMLPHNHKMTSYSFDQSKNEYVLTCTMSGSKQEINHTLNELLKHPAVFKVTAE